VQRDTAKMPAEGSATAVIKKIKPFASNLQKQA